MSVRTRHLFIFFLLLILFSCSAGGESDPDSSDGDTSENLDGDALDGDALDGDVLDGDALDGDVADGENPPLYPDCGSSTYEGSYLIPGPMEEGHDTELAALAQQYDRSFHTFTAAVMGVNTELTVGLDATVDTDGDMDEDTSDAPLKRDLVEGFLREGEGWDFQAWSGGLDPLDVIDSAGKVAGLYGGAGIVADALRYATLRDQGGDCAEIAIAREQLLNSLEGLHMAFAMPGRRGSVARGYAKTDFPGLGKNELESGNIIPLFDGEGQPLPEVKNNGVWREDQSGEYPNYIWEDSCSRDMLLGWAMASGICMEVIRLDPSFAEPLRRRIRDDASAVLDNLREIHEYPGIGSFDLELTDAEGRTTLHGYLNEHCVESSLYTPNFQNGFYSLMALGIVGAFAYAADDPEAWSYLNDELVAERGLADIALETMTYVNMDRQTNWSNYNMAFFSAWLAMRYIEDEQAREAIRQAIAVQLYNTPDKLFQPVEQKMSLYDITYLSSELNGSVFGPPDGTVDETALANGLQTLSEYVEPPYWDYKVEHCDSSELESGQCTLDDGTEVEVYWEGGRKGSTLCNIPIPKRMRRPSNFEWRSNPYEPNGGGNGVNFYSGVSFRVAYWMGRWTRVD